MQISFPSHMQQKYHLYGHNSQQLGNRRREVIENHRIIIKGKNLRSMKKCLSNGSCKTFFFLIFLVKDIYYSYKLQLVQSKPKSFILVNRVAQSNIYSKIL